MLYLTGLFLLFLFFNCFTPLFPGDDYIYTYIWQYTNLYSPLPDDAVKIMSFSDLFVSLSNHYQTWCGRLTNHFLAMFFLWQDKLWFNLANSFVSVLLLVFIILLGNKGKFNKQYIPFVFISVWLFQLNWANVFVWIEGSCNYLWSCFFVLLFLYLFIYKATLCNNFNKPIRFVLYLSFFLFSTIVGCTNENSIFAILFCLFFYLCYNIRKKNYHIWEIVGYVGVLIGYLILLSSQGNFQRISCELQNYIINRPELIYIFEPILSKLENKTFWLFALNKDLLLFNLTNILTIFVSQLFLWGFIAFYFIEEYRIKTNKIINDNFVFISQEDKKIVLFFVVCAFLSEFVLVFSPPFPLRVGFFSLVFLLISCVVLLRNNFFDYLLKAKFFSFLRYYILLLFIVSFIGSLFVFPLSYFNRLAWIETIKLKDSMSNRPVIEIYSVDDDDFISKLSLFSLYKNSYFNLSTDENSWINISFKKYHNLHAKVKICKPNNNSNSEK